MTATPWSSVPPESASLGVVDSLLKQDIINPLVYLWASLIILAKILGGLLEVRGDY